MNMLAIGNSSLSSRIAAELRAEMARQKITYTAVAKELGISRQALSVRLNGKRPLTPEIIEAAGRLLHRSASSLVQLGETTQPN